jgi:protein TonB
MVTRYAGSLSLGSLITFSLLFLMQQMIATGRSAVDGREPFRFTPYTAVERQPTVDPPREPRVLPPEIEQPPALPPIVDGTGGGPEISVLRPPAPPVQRGLSARSDIVDGDLLPIVKVQPNYPSAALRDGLEGSVVVEFTVTRTGSVADAHVVESTHRVFERAAIEAASKFRYRPRVVDSTPIEVHGVRNRISFELTR